MTTSPGATPRAKPMAGALLTTVKRWLLRLPCQPPAFDPADDDSLNQCLQATASRLPSLHYKERKPDEPHIPTLWMRKAAARPTLGALHCNLAQKKGRAALPRLRRAEKGSAGGGTSHSQMSPPRGDWHSQATSRASTAPRASQRGPEASKSAFGRVPGCSRSDFETKHRPGASPPCPSAVTRMAAALEGVRHAAALLAVRSGCVAHVSKQAWELALLLRHPQMAGSSVKKE